MTVAALHVSVKSRITLQLTRQSRYVSHVCGNFTVTLTLNTTIQLLHKILWFIIMYYHTKFGSKRIRSSKDTVDIVIF